jgi:hypothetical protein
MNRRQTCFLVGAVIRFLASFAGASDPARDRNAILELREGWRMQSSYKVEKKGAAALEHRLRFHSNQRLLYFL